MKNTYIADHVEHFDSDPSNLYLMKLCPNQLVWEWAVVFRDPESEPGSYKMKKFGFSTKEKAEGFLEGWNEHRNTIKEMLFIERMKRTKRPS
jgi:hypothetical protein